MGRFGDGEAERQVEGAFWVGGVSRTPARCGERWLASWPLVPSVAELARIH